MNTWMPSFPKIHRRKKHTALFGPALAADLWAWLPQVTIALTILIAAALFLWPSPFEFPMDDSYIHFVYAQNLSEHGRLFFNDPAEKGVGSSSLLWVLALGAANRAGLSLHWAAKLLGILSLAGLGVGLFQLLRPLLPPWPSLAGALLVVLSGHMIWFALSGMETTLFLALGVAALLCYREERWAWLGVVLGLLAITRVDGAMLALVIGVFDIWRRKAITRGLLVAAAKDPPVEEARGDRQRPGRAIDPRQVRRRAPVVRQPGGLARLRKDYALENPGRAGKTRFWRGALRPAGAALRAAGRGPPAAAARGAALPRPGDRRLLPAQPARAPGGAPRGRAASPRLAGPAALRRRDGGGTGTELRRPDRSHHRDEHRGREHG